MEGKKERPLRLAFMLVPLVAVTVVLTLFSGRYGSSQSGPSALSVSCSPGMDPPAQQGDRVQARQMLPRPGNAEGGLFAAPIMVERPASIASLASDTFLVSLEKCEYSTDELKVHLQKPHGTDPKSNRYLYQGSWYTQNQLQVDIALAKDAVLNEEMCVVLHTKDGMQCAGKECLHEIFIRKGTSDVKVVQQLMEKGEYNFLRGYHPRTILDAGGNIGLASKLFATMWPDARIITLEPSSGNFNMLKKNIRSLPNVFPLHAGLWQRPSKLFLALPSDNKHDNEWGFRAKEVEDSALLDKNMLMYGLNVDLLLDLFKVDAFDYLKIDIEGSEEQVFTPHALNSMQWVKDSILVSIEIHTTAGDDAIKKVMEPMKHFVRRTESEYVFWRNIEREKEIMT